MKESYIKVFIDKEYPFFLDKYLEVKTLARLKNITQFCGCDYTKLYSPRFLFTRYDHSLVVAHMVWHFTHDKKSTIAALLHDVGTPCFAHTIDLVFGDYINQESSEIDIVELINKDKELVNLLKEDGMEVSDLSDLSKYPILENKSPRLCADRLDGVLHTCYIWLHTNNLKEIKEAYNDLVVLTNEDNLPEIGFTHEDIALKFVKMVYTYAMELRSNRNKYVMKYISEIIKKAKEKDLINLNDLYIKKEKDIVNLLEKNFASWKTFKDAIKVINTNKEPDGYYISFNSKKRNTIPIVKTNLGNKRIDIFNKEAKKIYNLIANYQSTKYSYIKGIKEL